MSRPTLGTLSRDFRWGHQPLVPRSAEPERIHRPRHEVSTDWARRPSMRLLRAAIQAGVLKPLMHLELRPLTNGREVLREVGETPCVIVANHTSHLDTAVLIAALPAQWRRRTAVAAAADYFFDAWWRAVPTALAFGSVPIERRGGAPSRTPADLLGRGWNLVVFPEGTRSRDGVQGRFRLGAATLALAAGAPVLPVAITGAYAAMPRGRNWPAPGRPRVSVRFGAPLVPYPGEEAVAFTARIAAAVTRLQNEGVGDWYESLRTSNRVEQPAVGYGEPALSGRTAAPAAFSDADNPAFVEPAAAAAAPGSWRRTWSSTAPVPAPVSHQPRVWR